MARPTKTKAIARLKDALDETNNFAESGVKLPKLNRWRTDTRSLVRNTFEHPQSYLEEFERIEYGPGPQVPGDGYIDYRRIGLEAAAKLIQGWIDEIKKYSDENDESPALSTTRYEGEEMENKVFVIHGRDDAARETVARFLERLGLKPVILFEQPSQGRTIIEKIEDNADVRFAVGLLTPDDLGAHANNRGELAPRARQNVIFELGYFAGKLSRKRVCALVKEGLEIPSDYDGVVYVDFDNAGAWKMKVVQELKAAGFNVDANRAVEL